MKIASQQEYLEAYDDAQKNPQDYWRQKIKDYEWIKKPQVISSGGFTQHDTKWFEDGILNVTVNALDRHVNATPDRIALNFEPNNPMDASRSYTYKETHRKVCQIADLLARQGIKKGDVVCLYMSMIPELLLSVLACARIGAVHSVVFGGFSAAALKDRLEDCDADLIITNDGGYRGDKLISIKNTVDAALATSRCLAKVMVWRHSGIDIDLVEPRDFVANDLIDQSVRSFPPSPMLAEDPLFILYTSGSTGKPKGLLHTTAGYMVWAAETYKHVFQMDFAKDIFWCTADVGWITGHTYMTYGPLLAGSTQVIFEGIPTWPDASRFWGIVEKYHVTHFYTAPTAIRALQACEPAMAQKHSLDSLKVLGSVGEPINEDAWHWYKSTIGQNNCPIVDTWWQTETGGIMISNLAGVTPEKPTCATKPLPGVKLALLDQNGAVLTGATQGNLCITEPWPGMARTIYGDHKRYVETYFSTYEGCYFTGDGAKRDDQGNYRISGRVDDVVNISGHRIGTAEVEDIITEHQAVIEASVVGGPHPIKGQCLHAFVVGRGSMDQTQLLYELNALLKVRLGSICKLETAQTVSALPKTRSGKIMRRILRKIVNGGTEFGDISTLLNPDAVASIYQEYSSRI